MFKCYFLLRHWHCKETCWDVVYIKVADPSLKLVSCVRAPKGPALADILYKTVLDISGIFVSLYFIFNYSFFDLPPTSTDSGKNALPNAHNWDRPDYHLLSSNCHIGWGLIPCRMVGGKLWSSCSMGSPGLLRAVLRTGTNVMLQLILQGPCPLWQNYH